MVLGDVKSGECHGDGTYSDIYQWFERASKGTCGFVRAVLLTIFWRLSHRHAKSGTFRHRRGLIRATSASGGVRACAKHTPLGSGGALWHPPYITTKLSHTHGVCCGVVSGYSSTGTHSHQAHVSFETSVRTRVVIFSQILELDSC